MAYQFYRLLRATERLRILPQQIRVNLPVLLRLARVSATGILQFAIAHPESSDMSDSWRVISARPEWPLKLDPYKLHLRKKELTE